MKTILIAATLLFGITTQSIAQKKTNANKYNIGNVAHGGIVFWIDATGEHGLVCTKKDQSSGIQWYNGSYTKTKAHGYKPKSGKRNTFLIMKNQGSNANNYAAGICANLTFTEARKTYNDWYLPSIQELSLMYKSQKIINARALANGGTPLTYYYWSSTEFEENQAYYFNMNNESEDSTTFKETLRAVRAVRTF
jgi:hypothetical protein